MLQWKGECGCGLNAVRIRGGMCPRFEPQLYLEVACCSGMANVAVAPMPCTFVAECAPDFSHSSIWRGTREAERVLQDAAVQQQGLEAPI